MKALSLSQPWDYVILHPPFKDVENRSWYTSYRGRIVIHRAKSIDKAGWLWMRENQARLGLTNVDIAAMWGILESKSSGLVGEVDITDVVECATSRWAFPGQMHWLLENPKPYDEIIPYRGRMGLFEVDL